MAELTIPPNWCRHLTDVNDTTWRAARQFSYFSEAVIQPTIFSLGIITNILSLFILVGMKMNKTFRVCLISLTISDLFATVFGLVQLLVEVIVYCGEVPEGYLLTPVIINNALYMAFLISVSTSSTLVAFIAFIRNMMFLKPIKARVYFTAKMTRRVCGAIFITTLVLYLPNSLQEMWLLCYKEIEKETGFCAGIAENIDNLKKLANGYLFFTVTLYGPLMLIVYAVNLVCIRVTLRKSADVIGHVTGTDHQGDQRRQMAISQMTKMVSLILICDVICLLPSTIQGAGLVFNPEDGVFEKKDLFFELLDPIAEIFLAVRPTYNFWLYVFHRPEFRIRLRQLMGKAIRKQRCRRTISHSGSCSDNLDTTSSRSKTTAITVSDQ